MHPLFAPPSQKGLGYWFLLAFLGVAWVCTIGQALPNFIPGSLVRMISLGCLALYPILMLAAIWQLRAHKNWLSRSWFDYVMLFTVGTVALGFYGLLRGNAPRVTVFDFLAYLPVIGGLLLGRLDRVWSWLMPPVLLLTAVSVVMAVRLTDAQILTDRSILNNQVGSFFEGALTLAPLLAIVAASERRNRWYFPLLLASLGAVFVYLYFGRRGISVRAGVEVLCAAVIVPMIVGTTDRALRNVAILVGFVFVLLAYFPFDVLISRYLGRYGLMDTLTTDNARWSETLLLWQELNWWELIVGRGFGGVFLVDRIESYTLDEIGSGSFGKIGTHLGLALPFLKGGVVFAVVYFLPGLKLAGALRFFRNLDPITMGCAVAVPIWLATQTIEGALSYSTPWVGFGVGLLLSRAERVGVPGGPRRGAPSLHRPLTPRRPPVPRGRAIGEP